LPLDIFKHLRFLVGTFRGQSLCLLVFRKDELKKVLLDFVFGEVVDLMDEVESNCRLVVLAPEGPGVALEEAGVEIIVLEISIPDDDDPFVGGPAERPLLLAASGLVQAKQRQLLLDFVREGEVEFAHPATI
jgi:hypothetical protein